MFSEDYKRGVCLDDLDVGLDWNALIIILRWQVRIPGKHSPGTSSELKATNQEKSAIAGHYDHGCKN